MKLRTGFYLILFSLSVQPAYSALQEPNKCERDVILQVTEDLHRLCSYSEIAAFMNKLNQSITPEERERARRLEPQTIQPEQLMDVRAGKIPPPPKYEYKDRYAREALGASILKRHNLLDEQKQAEAIKGNYHDRIFVKGFLTIEEAVMNFYSSGFTLSGRCRNAMDGLNLDHSKEEFWVSMDSTGNTTIEWRGPTADRGKIDTPSRLEVLINATQWVGGLSSSAVKYAAHVAEKRCQGLFE